MYKRFGFPASAYHSFRMPVKRFCIFHAGQMAHLPILRQRQRWSETMFADVRSRRPGSPATFRTHQNMFIGIPGPTIHQSGRPHQEAAARSGVGNCCSHLTEHVIGSKRWREGALSGLILSGKPFRKYRPSVLRKRKLIENHVVILVSLVCLGHQHQTNERKQFTNQWRKTAIKSASKTQNLLQTCWESRCNFGVSCLSCASALNQWEKTIYKPVKENSHQASK